MRRGPKATRETRAGKKGVTGNNMNFFFFFKQKRKLIFFLAFLRGPAAALLVAASHAARSATFLFWLSITWNSFLGADSAHYETAHAEKNRSTATAPSIRPSPAREQYPFAVAHAEARRRRRKSASWYGAIEDLYSHDVQTHCARMRRVVRPPRLRPKQHRHRRRPRGRVRHMDTRQKFTVEVIIPYINK